MIGETECKGCNFVSSCKIPFEKCMCKNCLVRAICTEFCYERYIDGHKISQNRLVGVSEGVFYYIQKLFRNDEIKKSQEKEIYYACLEFEYSICDVFRSKQKHIIEKCPCRECLIKTMCLDECENYLEFYSENDI